MLLQKGMLVHSVYEELGGRATEAVSSVARAFL